MKLSHLRILSLLLTLILLLGGCIPADLVPAETSGASTGDLPTSTTVPGTQIPAYSGTPYAVLENNQPGFSSSELTDESYELYSALDALGRCGVAIACIGIDLMPTEERGSIGSVKPSGWQSVKYDVVDGKYLYNRCHLIGFQLSGENANRENLITGTRYLNVEGMLPFEDMIADYVRETDNHVLYRVTPLFYGSELVARGVTLEAYSVEDEGEGIGFHVFVYNVQPGIVIDYASGESYLAGSTPEVGSGTTPSGTEATGSYVLNTATEKFHLPDCTYAKNTKEENKQTLTCTRDELIDWGYSPCGSCKP